MYTQQWTVSIYRSHENEKKKQHTELAMYYKLLDLTTRPHTASPRYCGQPCGFHVFCECPHAHVVSEKLKKFSDTDHSFHLPIFLRAYVDHIFQNKANKSNNPTHCLWQLVHLSWLSNDNVFHCHVNKFFKFGKLILTLIFTRFWL